MRCVCSLVQPVTLFLTLANTIPHSKKKAKLSLSLSLSPSHHLPTWSRLNKLWFALPQDPTHKGG